MQSSGITCSARLSNQVRSQAWHLQDAHEELDGDQGRVAALHQRFKEEASALSAEIQQLSGSIAQGKHGAAHNSIARSHQLKAAIGLAARLIAALGRPGSSCRLHSNQLAGARPLVVQYTAGCYACRLCAVHPFCMHSECAVAAVLPTGAPRVHASA